MSFAQDLTTALELLCRTAIPDIPAGAQGVELAMRLPSELSVEKLPHLVIGGEVEHPIQLRFRQQRVTVELTFVLMRRGATHAELLADFGAIRAGYDVDPTLGGVIEAGILRLEGIHEPTDGTDQIVRMSFDGIKVLG